jgi:threonine/homoserine efflux transporter RhtA
MKSWYSSKTIWVNAIALIGSIVISQGLDPGQWAEISTVVIAGVNVVLRLITKEPINLG